MSGLDFAFSFGNDTDSYVCDTPNGCKWSGAPDQLCSFVRQEARNISSVAIGPNGSWWVNVTAKSGGNRYSCHNLPGQLYDAIAREGSFGMEVSLGPSGSWFWKNAWRNGRDIHLSALDAVINQELYENRRTLDWIGFGRNSGVAIYSDGAWTPMGVSQDLLQVMRASSKRMSRIYLSPLNDVHYVIKWEDGSASYCLPSSLRDDFQALTSLNISGHVQQNPGYIAPNTTGYQTPNTTGCLPLMSAGHLSPMPTSYSPYGYLSPNPTGYIGHNPTGYHNPGYLMPYPTGYASPSPPGYLAPNFTGYSAPHYYTRNYQPQQSPYQTIIVRPNENTDLLRPMLTQMGGGVASAVVTSVAGVVAASTGCTIM